jgi:hypothetical protein
LFQLMFLQFRSRNGFHFFIKHLVHVHGSPVSNQNTVVTFKSGDKNLYSKQLKQGKRKNTEDVFHGLYKSFK